ncbi:MAG TPA: response regulator transcription factor [Gammaproteobacteria bacterium]|nr:response regulator transcription factor [Gammaproteobacteria bacterium]
MTITVLLVDDHVLVREGLAALLAAQHDIRVVGQAAHGREALALAETLAPRVVVMDIAMPELNGLEATERLCERLPATRVVVLSMHSTREHVARALRAGALGFLLKEDAASELVQAVRTVAAGRRYLSRALEHAGIAGWLEEDKDRTPLERLSPREREVLQGVVEGHSSTEIASFLGLSPKTVETYRSRLMEKLGVNDVPSLVKFALQHGLTSLRQAGKRR